MLLLFIIIVVVVVLVVMKPVLVTSQETMTGGRLEASLVASRLAAACSGAEARCFLRGPGGGGERGLEAWLSRLAAACRPAGLGQTVCI